MRVLHEAMPTIRPDLIRRWNKASKQDRIYIKDKIVDYIGNPGLKNIDDLIFYIFATKGIDTKENPFIKLFSELEFEPKAEDQKKFALLLKLYNEENLDINNPILRNASLYDRDLNDFNYTVKLFDTVADDDKLSKYYRDTTQIYEEDLFEDDGKTIKQVGRGNTEDYNYLWCVVNSWSGENGSNNAPEEEEEEEDTSNLHSPEEYFKENDVPMKNYSVLNNLCSGFVQRYWKEIPRFYKPELSNVEEYKNEINALFNQINTKYVNRIKNDAIKNRTASTPIKDQVEKNPSLEYPGSILYSNTYEHDIEGKKDLEYSYWIYDNNKWEPLSENELLSELNDIQSTKKENIKKLLQTPSIEKFHNKASVAAGITKNLDMVRKLKGEDDEFDIEAIL